MNIGALPIVGRFFSSTPTRGDFHVALPEGWDQWSPAKGEAGEFFNKVGFVRFVRDTAVETANSVMPEGGEVHARHLSAEKTGLPDSALHFAGYTGHFADVHARANPASKELEGLDLRVFRYEGHPDRFFGLAKSDEGVTFQHGDRGIVVTREGALQEY